MKMKIDILVERWNDERPEGFISMSEKQKKEEFKKFCDWNGFDLTNLADLFIEYDVQQSVAFHLQQVVRDTLEKPHESDI